MIKDRYKSPNQDMAKAFPFSLNNKYKTPHLTVHRSLRSSDNPLQTGLESVDRGPTDVHRAAILDQHGGHHGNHRVVVLV